MGSSWTRDQTRVPYIGRQILNHCATREVLIFFLNYFIQQRFIEQVPCLQDFVFSSVECGHYFIHVLTRRNQRVLSLTPHVQPTGKSDRLYPQHLVRPKLMALGATKGSEQNHALTQVLTGALWRLWREQSVGGTRVERLYWSRWEMVGAGPRGARRG